MNTYLVCELLKIKEKYEKHFNEKFGIYDKAIKQILSIKYISKANDYKIFIGRDLKNLENKINVKI